MRISQKARYAVTAAFDLALRDPARRGVPSAEVARRAGVPGKFLEAILRDLRQAGVVTSRRGPDGGHRLAHDPARITVRAIVEAIDGPLSNPPARRDARSAPEAACVRAMWTKVESAVEEILGKVTLEDLRREANAPGPLDFNI